MDARSASDSGAAESHWVPAALLANGQSTENRTRSGPISAIAQRKAASEKKPLVVTWKCVVKVSRKLRIGVSRDKASSIRAIW